MTQVHKFLIMFSCPIYSHHAWPSLIQVIKITFQLVSTLETMLFHGALRKALSISRSIMTTSPRTSHH